MAHCYSRIVTLWVHPGQEAAFDAFEREVARIMARLGGRIDQAVRLAQSDGERAGETPFEVHIVSFPDQAAFEAYGADSDTLALRARQDRIIARTEIGAGRPAGPYQRLAQGSKNACKRGLFAPGDARVTLACFSGSQRLTREKAKPRTPARS